MLQPETFTPTQPPKVLKIGNLFFSIKFIDNAIERGSKCFGWCDTDLQHICISSRVSPSKQADTFLHEIIHALHWFFSMPDKPDEELVCRNISSGINMVFFDNPEWFQWYTKSIQTTTPTNTNT